MGSQSKMIRRYPTEGRDHAHAKRQRQSWGVPPGFLDLSKRARKRRKRR